VGIDAQFNEVGWASSEGSRAVLCARWQAALSHLEMPSKEAIVDALNKLEALSNVAEESNRTEAPDR
jgi:hypothetical protein